MRLAAALLLVLLGSCLVSAQEKNETEPAKPVYIPNPVSMPGYGEKKKGG